ncbi:hypothetical protein CH366_18370 [Leptospira harrisiae]|uniref:Uncharacterized protein n=1 Tax=Leptospira harrisiae TaxID=2023189 RepID=A0A2N0AGG5_9LEPT|nr:hypothetical protein CH364_17160 [Leptospira harrisiae]PKA06777.1 hypothetical protein CH366_18370 [Leptospira harrisiae]
MVILSHQLTRIQTNATRINSLDLCSPHQTKACFMVWCVLSPCISHELGFIKRNPKNKSIYLGMFLSFLFIPFGR